VAASRVKRRRGLVLFVNAWQSERQWRIMVGLARFLAVVDVAPWKRLGQV
jgi:hypothetical protein